MTAFDDPPETLFHRPISPEGREEFMTAALGDVVPPEWSKAFAAGWKIVPGSCECGGHYLWMSPASVISGCVCHTEPDV
jgi:hypothetical protein